MRDFLGYRSVLFYPLTANQLLFIDQNILNVAFVGVVAFGAPEHFSMTKLCPDDKQNG